MSSSIIDSAADSGTSSVEPLPRVREHGMERVREHLVSSLTGIAEASLYEAERLIQLIRSAASQRILDHDGCKGTEPLDTAQIAEVIGEALSCIDVAAVHLTRLRDDIHHYQRGESPF